ncbi:hypothetical protein F511_23475 [Dorcoceras hygrometricum]|uniref:Uncharacterized protein n=1 Tax=Dorcoceras hygrometricum TaxID=472368 RepID=A0A2Z7B976_9LAMI|nr:hypothetical protein F511_23475 [Dorcoceras hygrometricum]
MESSKAEKIVQILKMALSSKIIKAANTKMISTTNAYYTKKKDRKKNRSTVGGWR